jgi:hypothetical protein
MNEKKKGKKHGFDKPFSIQQVAVWSFFVFDLGTFYGLELLFYGTTEKVTNFY